jgi:hypothetical protein
MYVDIILHSSILHKAMKQDPNQQSPTKRKKTKCVSLSRYSAAVRVRMRDSLSAHIRICLFAYRIMHSHRKE